MHFLKKTALILVILSLLVGILSVSGLACSTIYVGSDLTADGTTLLARSEDMSNSTDKLQYVIPAGYYTAGDTLTGCYGFSWTFEQDSYSFTAWRDENGVGVGYVCPDCGSTDPNHMPYTEAGTNEKGLTVSATESLFSNTAIGEEDPLTDEGIAEPEIPTVLLAQCATAREALDLLCSIYDTLGANEASGLLIADQSEAWYIESTTGHQYIAVKLPADMLFIEPNMCVMGLFDLDDTENVVASDALIETAVAAGTFVGDEAENTIDFRASYSVAIENSQAFEGYGSVVNERMINGLNAIVGEGTYTEDNITDTDFCISNVAEDGSIVTPYTNITPAESDLTVDYVINWYKTEPVGRPNNQETHIFQIDADAETELGTVEWIGMANDCYTVFVPCWPMLLSETYQGYRFSTAGVEFTEEEPAADAVSYPYEEQDWSASGEPTAIEGWRVLPENWQYSIYWCYDIVANELLYGDTDEEDEAYVLDLYSALQQDMYTQFAAASETLAELDGQARVDFATQNAIALAMQAHVTALGAYYAITD